MCSLSTSSPIQTVTVGSGIQPDLLLLGQRPKTLADYTAGGDLHPALKTFYSVVHMTLYSLFLKFQVQILQTKKRTNVRFSVDFAFPVAYNKADGR